jgi:DNA polymerase I-like protein with 3'-5' exonuclease and polymerase domains
VRPQDAVKNIWRFPARYAAEYGEQDPESTLLLMENLRLEMAEQGLMRAYQTEMRLVPVVHAMRRRGIRVNLDRALALRDDLLGRSERALAQLRSHMGYHRDISIDDIRQRDWLVQAFSGENVEYKITKDEDGNDDLASFTKDWMRRAEHWLPRLIAEAKQCREVADKFVQSYLIDYAHNGRVHATINQWRMEGGGTRSHRLSYADPPLQQAPSRGEPFDGWDLTAEIAGEYRKCFDPETGQYWFAPDYSQQEYRLIVSDAVRENLPKAREAAQLYIDDPKTDFHNLVVQWTGLGRRHAKDCNFAKAFGAGVPKFASMISKPLEEAASIMGTYDEELPFVKALGRLAQKMAERRGYIRLFDGARCHFDKWESGWLDKAERERGWKEQWGMDACDLETAQSRAETDGHPWQGKRLRRAFAHKGMNRRIQGNAARQMKMAMVECGENVEIPLIQMHDELGFSLDSEKKAADIVEIMRTVYQCRVPFQVDAEWGTTWGDAKHASLLEAKRAAAKPRRTNA